MEGGRDPDLMVMDLDPGPPAGLSECSQAAVRIRDRLDDDGVAGYPKMSGRKGMQLCCPVSARQSAEVVSAYARRVAEELARATPDLITAQMAKRLRPGKIFIDWSQNSAAKTTVAPYSLRAQPVPAASAPLTWAEVEAAAEGAAGVVRPFTAAEVLARTDAYGDLLADLLSPGPDLPD